MSQRTGGTNVVLFARLSKVDRTFWCLGPATYVSHQGERPIAMTWRLREPLPGDLFAQFTAAGGVKRRPQAAGQCTRNAAAGRARSNDVKAFRRLRDARIAVA